MIISPELMKETLARLPGGPDFYADLYVEHSKSITIQMEDGKVEKLLEGSEAGAGLRSIVKEKTFYAYSNELARQPLLEAAAALKGVSREGLTSSSFTADIDLTRKAPKIDLPIKIYPSDVHLDKKIAVVKAAEAAARGFNKAVRQVGVTYRELFQRVQIASSDGRHLPSGSFSLAEDERLQTVLLVHVVAEENGVVQTGYEAVGGFVGFELFDEQPAEAVALTAARRALQSLKARKAPGGRMPVVLSCEAGGTMIHEAVGHGLEADLSGQNLSVFSGRLGERIAADIITVLDDSTLKGKRGSFRFDDEGVPSQKTVLVENGVLKNFMYDKLSAMKAGAGIKSTGNGRRQSFRYRPIPRMTNTMIAPGKTAPPSILQSTPRGLFVKKMGGGQVNTLTGDFVFEVSEGYLIENGRMGEPVRGATLAGNGPEVLKTIDLVGSDLGFSIGTCGKDSQGVPVSDAQPTLRIPELVVGGAL